MYGAILGDMIGAPYEFDRGDKTKDFPLFSKDSRFTDDTVMTIAVAEALLDTLDQPDEAIRAAVVRSMQKWGKKYPHAGYGGRFSGWLRAVNPRPYGSYGNGSAMRVSAAGWLFEDLETTRHMARLTAEVTHNHPEGIKGAEAIAAAIFLARTGGSKAEIRDYIVREFDYDLTRTCDEIRPTYRHDESCQRTVPEAVTAFMEGTDFEDVIRTAVSLGGDCDTLTCIAGGIAEAFYGVPEELIAACRDRLPEDMLQVVDRFRKIAAPVRDSFLDGNEVIEAAMDRFRSERSNRSYAAVLDAIAKRIRENGHFIIPIIRKNDHSFLYQMLRAKDGKPWLVAFTSHKAYAKGQPSEILSNFIDSALYACLENGAPGFIVNPWDGGLMLPRDAIEAILLADRGKAAGKGDWKNEPMPEQRETFTMRRHITRVQMRFLRQGNIPQEMEDKWFWYMEGNTLYAHRSWTGFCVFILRFDPDSDEIRVTVNRHPEQYTSDGLQEDEATINDLLDWWCQPHYDYYNEWMSETLRTLEKQGKLQDDAE